LIASEVASPAEALRDYRNERNLTSG